MTRTVTYPAVERAGPISIIIPAYNEAARVGRVLDAATHLPYVTQIIVVDDASDDDTAGVVRHWQRRHPRIELVGLHQNHGKAGAIAQGLQHATQDTVTFLDADLSGLTPDHIRRLVEPVRHGHCAMTIGLFHDGRPSTDLTHRVLPYLSGQRCLRWPLFADINLLPDSGWSLETALSLHGWFYGHATRRVPLNGVTHAMRPEKQPGLRGYLSHVAMWWHIARYALRFLRNKGLASIVKRLRQTRSGDTYLPRRQRPRRRSEPLAGRYYL